MIKIVWHIIIIKRERGDKNEGCKGTVRANYRYGREYTLEEVGSIYGLTRERIRQIRDHAILSIRKNRKNHNLLKECYYDNER